MVGLLGKKKEIDHLFDEKGNFTSVTLVEAGPCVILEIKERKIKLGFDFIAEKKVKKPLLGLFKRLNVRPLRFIKEIPKDIDREFRLGEELRVDIFNKGDFVDVTGTSKGKGFQGGVKRWGWKGGPKSHGSMSHRRMGSMGSSAFPGRVWKGKHLPGHMGNKRITIQNLEVLDVDKEKNLLVLKGAVPGHKSSYLIIKKAIKKKS